MLCVDATIFRIAHVYREVSFRPCSFSNSHRRFFVSAPRSSDCILRSVPPNLIRVYFIWQCGHLALIPIPIRPLRLFWLFSILTFGHLHRELSHICVFSSSSCHLSTLILLHPVSSAASVSQCQPSVPHGFRSQVRDRHELFSVLISYCVLRSRLTHS